MVDILKPLIKPDLQYANFKKLIRDNLSKLKIPKSDLLFIVKLLPSYIKLSNIVYVDDDGDDDDEYIIGQSDV